MKLSKQIRQFAKAYETLLRSGPVEQLLEMASKVTQLETINADLLEALEYARLNLAILTEAALPTVSKSVLSQDWHSGGVDILEKLDEAIRKAEEQD